jgi:hypothetical protein
MLSRVLRKSGQKGWFAGWQVEKLHVLVTQGRSNNVASKPFKEGPADIAVRRFEGLQVRMFAGYTVASRVFLVHPD